MDQKKADEVFLNLTLFENPSAINQVRKWHLGDWRRVNFFLQKIIYFQYLKFGGDLGEFSLNPSTSCFGALYVFHKNDSRNMCFCDYLYYWEMFRVRRCCVSWLEFIVIWACSSLIHKCLVVHICWKMSVKYGRPYSLVRTFRCLSCAQRTLPAGARTASSGTSDSPHAVASAAVIHPVRCRTFSFAANLGACQQQRRQSLTLSPSSGICRSFSDKDDKNVRALFIPVPVKTNNPDDINIGEELGANLKNKKGR